MSFLLACVESWLFKPLLQTFTALHIDKKYSLRTWKGKVIVDWNFSFKFIVVTFSTTISKLNVWVRVQYSNTLMRKSLINISPNNTCMSMWWYQNHNASVKIFFVLFEKHNVYWMMHHTADKGEIEDVDKNFKWIRNDRYKASVAGCWWDDNQITFIDCISCFFHSAFFFWYHFSVYLLSFVSNFLR